MSRLTRANERHELAISIFIACFPLAWLAFFNKTFYRDWNNHLWMIAYTGEYFRHHLSFPLTVNTNEVIGVPFPLFYGSLFYPIAGILSAVTGAALALRLILVALFWLQCTQIATLVETVYPGRYVAWAVSAVVSFAFYPLTNLYNRNAITEFVAASLLVSACSILLRAIYSKLSPETWVRASFAWMLLALSAGSHPITAVLGSTFFSVMLVGGLFGAANRRAFASMIVVNALMFMLVLSPWLYVTLRFHRNLWISQSLKSVVMFSDSIDLWWVRLLPIPFDIRPLRSALLSSISTPYLDAQIDFGLLVIVGFLVFQVGRRMRSRQMWPTREIAAAAACLGLFVLVSYGSVSPGVWRLLPQSLGFFQFPYRLVTYCDLLLLVVAVVLLSSLRRFHEELRNPLSICLAVAVALMAQGVLVKFNHAASIQSTGVMPGIGIGGERETLRHIPGSFPWMDYSDRSEFAGVLPDAPMVRLSTGRRTRFGEAERSVVMLPQSGNVSTNIEAFPWNRVVLDGRELPETETYISHFILSFALAPNGTSTQHVVGYKFVPERLYSVLRAISGIVLASWAAGLSVMMWWGHRSFSRSPMR